MLVLCAYMYCIYRVPVPVCVHYIACSSWLSVVAVLNTWAVRARPHIDSTRPHDSAPTRLSAHTTRTQLAHTTRHHLPTQLTHTTCPLHNSLTQLDSPHDSTCHTQPIIAGYVVLTHTSCNLHSTDQLQGMYSTYKHTTCLPSPIRHATICDIPLHAATLS